MPALQVPGTPPGGHGGQGDVREWLRAWRGGQDQPRVGVGRAILDGSSATLCLVLDDLDDRMVRVWLPAEGEGRRGGGGEPGSPRLLYRHQQERESGGGRQVKQTSTERHPGHPASYPPTITRTTCQ